MYFGIRTNCYNSCIGFLVVIFTTLKCINVNIETDKNVKVKNWDFLSVFNKKVSYLKLEIIRIFIDK